MQQVIQTQLDTNFSVRSRLTDYRKTLYVTVERVEQQNFVVEHEKWIPDLTSLHGKWKSVGVNGFTEERGTTFDSSYLELRQIEDTSNRDFTEVKIIKASKRFRLTVSISIISCFTSFLRK